MTIDIGIALKLDPTNHNHAIMLSKRISSIVETEFNLDENSIPHITLFQGKFPRSNIGNVLFYLNNFCSKLDKLCIIFSSPLFIRNNGNVFWLIEPSYELLTLHLNITHSLLPFSQGLLLEKFSELINNKQVNAGEIEQIKKYGMLLAGDQYFPHVTLCRILRRRDNKKVCNIDIPQSSYSAENIIVGSIGLFGEFKSIIDQFLF